MVADFKKNKKSGALTFFLRYGGVVVLLVVFIGLIVANVKIFKKKQELTSQVDNLKKQVQEIQVKNQDLKEGITKIDDIQYMEKVAREELDLQKQDEHVVSFVMPPKEVAASPVSRKSIFQTWFDDLRTWIKTVF